jgi:hypothetical protein
MMYFTMLRWIRSVVDIEENRSMLKREVIGLWPLWEWMSINRLSLIMWLSTNYRHEIGTTCIAFTLYIWIWFGVGLCPNYVEGCGREKLDMGPRCNLGKGSIRNDIVSLMIFHVRNDLVFVDDFCVRSDLVFVDDFMCHK